VRKKSAILSALFLILVLFIGFNIAQPVSATPDALDASESDDAILKGFPLNLVDIFDDDEDDDETDDDEDDDETDDDDEDDDETDDDEDDDETDDDEDDDTEDVDDEDDADDESDGTETGNWLTNLLEAIFGG
jgi:hypothetical protein